MAFIHIELRDERHALWLLPLFAVIVLTSAAAWFQHLYTCFTEEAWGFLIAGAVFFPVAVVHGIGIWFGVW